jgi:hypothetical protein
MPYWGYPQGYQQMQQGGYMPQGYGYGYGASGYGGMPMQWQGMQVNPSQQQQQYSAAGQQQTGVQYTMPQGP